MKNSTDWKWDQQIKVALGDKNFDVQIKSLKIEIYFRSEWFCVGGVVCTAIIISIATEIRSGNEGWGLP